MSMNKLKVIHVSYPLVQSDDDYNPKRWAMAIESQLKNIDPKNIVTINYLGTQDGVNGDRDITRFVVFYYE